MRLFARDVARKFFNASFAPALFQWRHRNQSSKSQTTTRDPEKRTQALISSSQQKRSRMRIMHPLRNLDLNNANHNTNSNTRLSAIACRCPVSSSRQTGNGLLAAVSALHTILNFLCYIDSSRLSCRQNHQDLACIRRQIRSNIGGPYTRYLRLCVVLGLTEPLLCLWRPHHPHLESCYCKWKRWTARI